MTRGDEALYAALYDWHNRERLRHQAGDVHYYAAAARSYGASNILVVGCGTGRVAGPLAASGWSVTGIDLDYGRLRRAKAAHPRLRVIHADGRAFQARKRFDLVIVPYSTAQLFPAGRPLRELAQTLAACASGAVVIDVSDHFVSRHDAGWEVAASGFCEELQCEVTEWQRISVREDHCEISIRFRLAGWGDLDVQQELWYFHPHEVLLASAEGAGLKLHRIERGYGGGVAPHRRIYHFVGT